MLDEAYLTQGVSIAVGHGSAERRKAIRALNHVHTRIANRRNDFAHKTSRELVNRYQVIAFEKLDIQEMQQSGFKTLKA